MDAPSIRHNMTLSQYAKSSSSLTVRFGTNVSTTEQQNIAGLHLNIYQTVRNVTIAFGM
jgi:hypothetical protein